MTDLFAVKKKVPKGGNRTEGRLTADTGGLTHVVTEGGRKAKGRSEIKVNTGGRLAADTNPEIRDRTKSEAKTPRKNTTLPLFPLCHHLLGVETSQQCYLVCISIFRELNNHASQIYLRQRLKKAATKGLKVPLIQKPPNRYWNVVDKCWESMDSQEQDTDYCVALPDLETFVRWAQWKTRKSKAEKNRLFKKFNINLTPEEAKEIKVPVENECLEVLAGCIPFAMELQYRVGKYRLDAFIPRLMLGIQIDEGGHSNYDTNEEKEYDTVLRDHNIVCIRFNPDEKYLHPPGLELVKRVWERTLSPDFSAFREKHKLG